MEKIAPVAVLSGAGLGIFGLIKSKLPRSLSDKLDEKTTDKK